jgi:NADH:ubiquinone oxidoreductase subunit F (NADH-binding)
LSEHLHRHGPLPTWARHRGEHPLLELVDDSGLRGRGGAGFSTAAKWRAVVGGVRPVVVANGAEGEPAIGKDACLLRHNPHLVLDGAQLAAMAVHAHEVVIWIAAGNGRENAVRAALAERRTARIDRIRMRVVIAPEQFLSGEKSAAVRGINGGPALPQATTPRVSERGVAGRPTLVQNVETLAHVALLARYGAPWFRSAGTPAEPGTMLATVLGAVAAPGVYEVALGTPLCDAIETAGGATAEIAAYLVGGYHGAWLPGTSQDVRLTHDDVRAAGGSLGAGLVVALPQQSCGLRETARVVRYLSDSSAKQCGPCMFGLDAIAGSLDELAVGVANESTIAAVERWSGMILGRGGCKHPDGTVRFVRSALAVFAEDVAAHAAGFACPPTHPVLPVPAHEVGP